MPPRSCSALAEPGGELGLGAGCLPLSGMEGNSGSAARIPGGAGLGGAARIPAQLGGAELPFGVCGAGAEEEDGVKRWLLSRGAAAQRGWAGDCSLLYISKVY